MPNRTTRTTAMIATAVLTAVMAWPSQAMTFVAWKVANVGFGDTLNVRKYPANSSQKQAAYPNGTVLQMTGRCTGGVDLHRIHGQPLWKQSQAVRHEWCEIWHDPANNEKLVTGWVYGKYISPHPF